MSLVQDCITSNFKRPCLIVMAVIFLSGFCFGQQAEAITSVPKMLNSYFGTIDYTVAIVQEKSTGGRFSRIGLKQRERLRRKLGFSKDEFCTVVIIEDQTRIQDFPKIRRSPRWRSLIRATADVSVDSLELLYQRWKVDKAGFVPEYHESVITGMLRRKFVFSDQKSFFSKDPFEWYLKRWVRDSTKADAALRIWLSDNADSPGLVNELEEKVKLELAFLKLIRKVQLSEEHNGINCPPRPIVPVSVYCGGDKGCQDNVIKHLTAYTQDYLYGLRSDEPDFVTIGINDKSIIDSNYPLDVVSDVLSCQCGKITRGVSLGTDIPGGNILMSDDFVLIGRDELEVRMDLDRQDDRSVKQLNRMGIFNPHLLSRIDLESRITGWLKDSVFNGKEVVWVGLKTPKQRYHKDLHDGNPVKPGYGFAPFFHIDVFISLLGPLDKRNPNKFHYLLSVPSIDYQSIQHLSEPDRYRYEKLVEDLRSFTLSAADSLEQSIRNSAELDLVLERVQIPMPVICELGYVDSLSYLKKTYAFSNGLMEKTDEGSTYFIPDYSSDAGNNDGYSHTKHRCAIKMTKRKLKSLGIHVKKVKYDGYFRIDGLHCAVKIVARGG